MMRFKISQYPNFYEVHGTRSEILSFIKALPQKYRIYENGVWCVHHLKCVQVAQIGYETWGDIEYSDLPEMLSSRIDELKGQWTAGNKQVVLKSTIDKSSAYASLYLTPNAPPEVVKAVWRSLAKLHHPDHGGDPEVFKRIQEAFRLIQE